MSNTLKTLITIGDWSLDKVPDGDVGICHAKCDSWMYRTAHRRSCRYCMEPIPDDIYGVWLLYNWDKLKDLL